MQLRNIQKFSNPRETIPQSSVVLFLKNGSTRSLPDSSIPSYKSAFQQDPLYFRIFVDFFFLLGYGTICNNFVLYLFICIYKACTSWCIVGKKGGAPAHQVWIQPQQQYVTWQRFKFEWAHLLQLTLLFMVLALPHQMPSIMHKIHRYSWHGTRNTQHTTTYYAYARNTHTTQR